MNSAGPCPFISGTDAIHASSLATPSVVGLDFRHGAGPFLITTCEPDKKPRYWEFFVDPLRRKASIDKRSLRDIEDYLDSATGIVFHNMKFDITALSTILPGLVRKWVESEWGKLHDTLLAGHILNSGRRHDLTTMGIEWLGVDIEKYEKAMETAVQKARRYCRSNLPHWRIAKHGLPEMPSTKAGSKIDKDGRSLEGGPLASQSPGTEVGLPRGS